MAQVDIAICKEGLGDLWLGGVNYFRNLLAVFDAAADTRLKLHFFTDDLTFLGDLKLSDRVQFHRASMLQRGSISWAFRRALQAVTGRDVLLLAMLKRYRVKAVVFSEVVGASRSGIRCFPWIPDFQFKHHPELFPAVTVESEQKRAERCIQCADGLIVSSESARRDAIGLFQARPDKVHVLRFAPKLDFQELTLASERDRVLQQYDIDRAYFFLPNQYWYHKNHLLVLEALKQISDEGGPMPLIISTGRTQDLRDLSHFPRFEALLNEHGLASNYRILGVIPRNDMMLLLANSLAVLNPSRFEGWSTTVEEAKGLGKTLLISDIAVHREQTLQTPNAEFFGTDDAGALAALMRRHQAGAREATGYPAMPEPTIYENFLLQYVSLLHQTADLDASVNVKAKELS